MITFGPFQFDPKTGELRRDGTRIHVPPQPAAALALLLSRPGALISRDEFRAAIWRGVDHLDFNAGLNFCIGQLRGILGDRGQSPQYIVAVPKRGYRFVAEVRTLVEDPAPMAAPAPPSPRPLGVMPWRRWPLAVAAGLVLALTFGSPTARGDAAGTNNLQAAKAVVRAAPGLADAGPEEIVTRLSLFDDAIARDAGFADAYVGRAEALLLLGQYRVRPPAAAYAEALVNAQRAVTLAPRHAGARAAYGAALIYATRDWREGAAELRDAIALDDRRASAHRWYSRYLTAIGRHDDAVTEAQRAVALTPASASAHTELGLSYFYAGRYADAIGACREAAGLLPAFAPARFCISMATAEATPAAETYWRERLEKQAQAIAGGGCACDEPLMAVPLVHLGEPDRALEILERGADRTSDAVLFAFVHPAFAPIRDTARFQFLLKRLGLPPS